MVGASNRAGLTRVELVVVAGMVAATIGLLLPALPQARATAFRRKCEHNLRHLAIATHNYHDTFNQFPTGMDTQYVGALVRLLPYLDQDILYRNFSFDPNTTCTGTIRTTARRRTGQIMFLGHPMFTAAKQK